MITYGFYVIIHLAIAIAILMLIAQMMGGDTMRRNGNHKVMCNTVLALGLIHIRVGLGCSPLFSRGWRGLGSGIIRWNLLSSNSC